MNRPLDTDEQRLLLQTARAAVKAYLETGEQTNKETENLFLKEKRGAFVTLKHKGSLRGCIGYPLPTLPLFDTIQVAAVSAASQDIRFSPLTMEEFPDVQFEISVLSLPETVSDVSEILVGTHGLIVSKGPRKGLLLPQVPLEWEWDRETFLEHTCLKAGLSKDAWRRGAKIEKFTAQVFSEGDFPSQ